MSLLSEGLSLVQQGREDEAISCWEKAVKIRPDAASMIWGNGGKALWEAENYEGAVRCFQGAARCFQGAVKLLLDNAEYLFTLGRDEEAIASYQKVLGLDFDFANAYYNIACLYGLQGDVDLAVQNLERAIKLDSKYRKGARTDPDFDRLRQNSQFQALLEK